MPEIISFFGRQGYAEKYPELDLLHEENFFLGCYLHAVELTVKTGKYDDLNIFEDTVLHLLGDIAWRVDEIAERSCLERDFVKALCDSLREREYISNVNTLTDKGRQYLASGDADTAKEPALAEKMCSVLVLPETQKILPILLTDKEEKYQYAGSKETYLYSIDVDDEGAGKAKKIQGRGKEPRGRNKCEIQPYEIRQLVSEYNRSHGYKIELVQHGAINSSTDGRVVYLHLKCGIQHGLVDQVIVSDGTSVLSSTLTDYLYDKAPEDIKKIQERATQAQTGEGHQQSRPRKKYAGLIEAWGKIKPIAEAVTPDEQRQQQEQIQQNIIYLHAVAEQTLHNYLKRHPLPEEQYDIFRNQNAKRNERLVKRMANLLGLDVNDAQTVLGKLDRYRLSRYQNTDVPELVCVLPLVIATSKLHDLPELRRLGRRRRFFLRDMERLDASKALRHGSETDKDVYRDHRQLRLTVETMLHTLLPDCQLETADEKGPAAEIEQVSQERLNAIVALRKALGWDLYERLAGSQNLKEDLLQVSPCYTGSLMPSPMDMVIILYRILEDYLRGRAVFMNERCSAKQDRIAYIQQQTDMALPDVLTCVNEGMVRAAADDKPASLGAYALVFFSRLPEERLQKCKELDVLDIIGQVIGLRGHGNHIELNLKLHEEEEAQLRDRVFTCIKEMENF